MIRLAVAQFLAAIGLKLWPHAEPTISRHRKLSAALFLLLCAACIAIALAGCVLLTGCTTVPFEPSRETFYRRDMQIEVDGITYPGYGVLPIRDVYQFKVTTKHDMDRFTATSCHRQFVEEKVGEKGWFSKTVKYRFAFKRSNGVEQSDPCPLQLTGSAESNEHSWAYFDFQTKADTLPATLECDGWKQTYHGASMCQSKKGLTQKIAFTKPVRTAFLEGCTLPTKDNLTFEYEMPRGRCVHVFCTKDKECHRLTTLGYDEAWPRGQK